MTVGFVLACLAVGFGGFVFGFLAAAMLSISARADRRRGGNGNA